MLCLLLILLSCLLAHSKPYNPNNIIPLLVENVSQQLEEKSKPPPQKVDRLAVWLKHYGNMEAVISVVFFSSVAWNLEASLFNTILQVGKLVKERLQLEAGSKQVGIAHYSHFHF